MGARVQASSAGKTATGLLGVRWGEAPIPQLFFRQGNAAADFGISFLKMAFRVNNWWKETGGISNTRTARQLSGSAALGAEKTQTSMAAVTTETEHSTGAWVTHPVTGIDRGTGETRVAAWTLFRLRTWGRSPKHVSGSNRSQDTSEKPPQEETAP